MTAGHRAAWLVLTFFGSGRSPVAPGTAGSLAALAVAVALREGAGFRDPWLLPALAAGIGFLHIAAGGRIPRLFGREDPPAVVSDEACGLWIALSAPLPADTPSWAHYALGFLLFRIFDIAKPLGVRRMERVRGALGVLLDDVLAGLYAGVVLWGLAATGALAALSR